MTAQNISHRINLVRQVFKSEGKRMKNRIFLGLCILTMAVGLGCGKVAKKPAPPEDQNKPGTPPKPEDPAQPNPTETEFELNAGSSAIESIKFAYDFNNENVYLSSNVEVVAEDSQKAKVTSVVRVFKPSK